jgi:hypothetical protein
MKSMPLGGKRFGKLQSENQLRIGRGDVHIYTPEGPLEEANSFFDLSVSEEFCRDGCGKLERC